MADSSKTDQDKPQVSNEERERVKNLILNLIKEIEVLTKIDPASDDEINKGVWAWEQKTFEKFGRNKREYMEKVRTKKDTCLKEIEKHKKKPFSISSSSNNNVSSRAISTTSVVSNNVTSTGVSTSRALPQSAAVPPQQLPQTSHHSSSSNNNNPNLIFQRKSPPPPQSISNIQTSNYLGVKDLKKIDELREPLEQCRSMLRILQVFGVGKREIQLKEEFMRIFQKTTEAIKQHKANKITATEMDQQVLIVSNNLRDLRGKLDPLFFKIQDTLNVKTLSEVLELESIPFGLMERIIQTQGNSAYASRCRNASMMLGGRHFLKKQRMNE